MAFKAIIGIIAILVAVIGYAGYFQGIFSGRIKPHVFSWLIWGLVDGIGFFAQIVKGGGAGSWVNGFSALVSFSIFLLALFKGTKEHTTFDWWALCLAFLAIILWIITGQPLLSVLLACLIDFLAFLPTIRKSYKKPHEEATLSFAGSCSKSMLGFIALESYVPTTWLYPIYNIIINGAFVLMILIRRRQTSAPAAPSAPSATP